MQFSRNVVSLRFSGDQRDIETCLGVKKVRNFGQELSVTLDEGIDPNDLLRHALERGRVERFEIGEMSLHDIFITKVKEEGGEIDEEVA
jgi:ABC-type uncharacterized transport system ATPase subunit